MASAADSCHQRTAIKEIKLNQNPFSAEYENLGFGRIEIITKPGTDTLHGNFQLTDSDAFFNSRNPFAANKAAYVNRAFNETLSGSIAHKLSWSLNANQNKVDTDAIIQCDLRSIQIPSRRSQSINPS